VRAYRAGYRPEERREIERGLRPGGGLMGVTATNALELGIDMGDLDASVLVGYPGTIASLWQQAGRAGRGTSRALSVLIGLDNPLDQYFMRHPADLFGRPHEHALIDPSNPTSWRAPALRRPRVSPVARLRGGRPRPPGLDRRGRPRRAMPGRAVAPGAGPRPAAAQPGPACLRSTAAAPARGPGPGRRRGPLWPGFVPAMVGLEEAGELTYQHDRWYPRAGAYPAEEVSLRALAGSRVALLNAADNYRLMEEMESTSALFRVHPGAMYLHQGESFLVRELDLDAGHAILEPVQVNYYTQPREINDVRHPAPLAHKTRTRRRPTWGWCGSPSRSSATGACSSSAKRPWAWRTWTLPAQTFDTVGLWWEVPAALAARVARAGARRPWCWPAACTPSSTRPSACCRSLPCATAGTSAGCPPPHHPDTEAAQVFIYDAFPGGVGIAEKGFELLADLWRPPTRRYATAPAKTAARAASRAPSAGITTSRWTSGRRWRSWPSC
jgi:DEAD/DEAH box helicase domain-containing protein